MQPGTRIGAYEIVSAIGAGGMGEVYRARDTQLHRDAAVKVLPALFARDPERIARFEREARTLAALNHPHIAQVYGIVELPAEAGGRALVMEFVDGEDLSGRIARSGALPLDEALPIALQIAEALEAAHEQGIVHRDLKPANIKVREDGRVKVLDFGLAKALAPADATAPATLDNSPTISSPFQMSRVGVILGTAAYMAPEQAKGKTVDKRADIWAFGCVLYEMLTGTRPFDGEDVTETLAAIVRADPDWSRLPPETPASVRTLLRRCLEKDRRERLPDVGAARLELRDALSSQPARVAATAVTPRRRSWVPWTIAGAAAAIALALMVRDVTSRPAPDLRVYRSLIVPPAPLSVAPVRRMQLSPDGSRLAFVAPDASGRPVIWVRALNDLQAQPLGGTAGAGAPFWSPDSRWIGFQAGGRLKKIEATGGSVATICVAGESPPGTWNRDDVILLTGGGNVIVRVPASGGQVVPVTRLDEKTTGRIHVSPFFLPDGRHFVFAAATIGTTATIHAASLDGGEAIRLVEGASPQYANGYLLFMRGSTLLAQRFDPDRLTLSGNQIPLAEDVQINTSTGTGAFSASQAGHVVYQTGAAVGTRLTWKRRDGTAIGSIGDSGPYADVALSPDRKWASATKISTDGHSDVWLLDLGAGVPRRVSIDAAGGLAAVWRGDSARIAYAARRDRTLDIYERSIAGESHERPLLKDGGDKFPLGYTREGDLLYFVPSGAARGQIWLLPLSGKTKPSPLFASDEPDQNAPALSPDGRTLAYVSIGPDGSRRLRLASFPSPTIRREVSSDAADSPHWRGDGKELFYVGGGRLMAVDVAASSGSIDVGAPHALFDVAVPAPALGMRSTFDVTPDGQRFLFNTWDASNAVVPITLVVNWPAALTNRH